MNLRRREPQIGTVTLGGKTWPFTRDEFEWLLEKLDPNDEWVKEVRRRLAALDAERENDAYMERGQPGGVA